MSDVQRREFGGALLDGFRNSKTAQSVRPLLSPLGNFHFSQEMLQGMLRRAACKDLDADDEIRPSSGELRQSKGESGMAADENRNGDRDQDREIGRYRQAAISTLEQLEWIVGYLHKIRKPELAQAVDRNRKQIIEKIR
jgi:hypothetical protein